MNNIVFKVTKKYMKLNSRRTAIAFMGITLMVVMMTCVFVGKETVMKYIDKVASLDKGSWHMIAYDVDAESAKTIASRGYTEMAGLSEQLYCIDLPQSGEPETVPFLNIKAYSADSFAMTNISMVEGRYPENSGEIIISEYAVENGADIKIGDKISGELFKRILVSKLDKGGTEFPREGISLPAGGSVEVPVSFAYGEETESFYEKKEPTGISGDYTVVGIMESPSYEICGGGSYAALTFLDEPHTDALNVMIRLDTDEISGTEEVISDIDSLTGEGHDYEFNNMLLAFSAMSGDSNINTIVIFMEVFFTLFTMAASVILIYNVFNMSFAERTRYLGMLSSVGATRRQKRQSIYFESFALLIPALPAGLLLGMGVVYGASQLLKPRFDTMLSIDGPMISGEVPMTLSFGISEIVTVLVMCAATVLISALIPAIKISKIPPVESVKGAADNYTKKKRFKTRKSLLEKGKPELMLAVNSTSRTKHLTRSIIRSVAVFSTLVMVTLYGANSIIKAVEAKTDEDGWAPVTEGYDYAVIAEAGNGGFDYAKQVLAADRNVTDTKEILDTFLSVKISYDDISDELMDAYAEIWGQYDDHDPADYKEYVKETYFNELDIYVLMVEDEEFEQIASKCGADMSLAKAGAEPAALVYNEVFLDTDRYRDGDECRGYKYVNVRDNILRAGTGDSFDLTYFDPDKGENVKIPLKAAGMADSDSIAGRYQIKPSSIYIFVNEAAKKEIISAPNVRTTGMILFEDKDENSIKQLNETFLAYSDDENEADNILLVGKNSFRTAASIKEIISDIIKILAYSFTALISMVCLLNLYNSIRGRAAERTKETAVLRSMGMTDKQFTKMHDLENLMLLGKGLFIAAVICTVLCAGLRYVVVDYFGNVRTISPVLTAVVISVITALITAVMTRLCSRSSKDDIISEIRKETV